MKELAYFALDCAKTFGAEYVDVRIVETEYEIISVRNDQVQSISKPHTLGMGIRVMINGAWGFAANPDLDKRKIELCAKRAVNVAKASGIVKHNNNPLSKMPTYKDVWKSKYDIDPFTISINDKISYLMKCNEEMQKEEKVKIAVSSMNFKKEHKIFISSEGSDIEQTIIQTGAGISATSINDNESQTRSYPSSFRGQYNTLGYELVEKLNLLENAERIAKESAELLTAKQCPSEDTTIIIGKSQLALQVHESIGHAVELDRVFGMEANYAGTSFVTTDKLKNRFKYASDIVNVFQDATIPEGLGSYAYDDDGVKAHRSDIIKDGIFVGYISSRETADQLGEAKSTGCNRATDFNNIPIVRMSNINLAPGKWDYDELIKDTKKGILMTENKSWSIDDKRVNFQFGCEIGYEIKDGKIVNILKNPTYGGITEIFWNNCDAITNEKTYQVWGTPNCGKGQPSQVIRVGHGVPFARFNNVKVGVGYDK
jgi:TldD protein